MGISILYRRLLLRLFCAFSLFVLGAFNIIPHRKQSNFRFWHFSISSLTPPSLSHLQIVQMPINAIEPSWRIDESFLKLGFLWNSFTRRWEATYQLNIQSHQSDFKFDYLSPIYFENLFCDFQRKTQSIFELINKNEWSCFSAPNRFEERKLKSTLLLKTKRKRKRKRWHQQ
jgi:hypothetical protein